MRIGIDASVLSNKWDGIGTILFDELRYIHDTDDRNEYYLYANKPLLATELDDPRFVIREDKGYNHLTWLLTRLPTMIVKDQIDIFWQPDFLFPFRIKNMKNVIHVHDLSAYLHHEYAPWKTNVAHKFFLKQSLKKADRIITVSKYVKAEVEETFPWARNKTEMIYPGRKMFINDLDINQKEMEKYLFSHKITPGNYLLFVGTFSPRKNASLIADAFMKYRQNGGTKKLVIAGNIAKKSEKTIKKLLQSSWKDEVVITGYVSEKQKKMLYYQAAMLLFPSRLEGFGFPLIEGFQAGIPVITGNVTCMPEIAGEAAIYLHDINDSSELAGKIAEVEILPEEKKNELIKKGYERVAFFDKQKNSSLIYQAIVNWKDQYDNNTTFVNK